MPERQQPFAPVYLHAALVSALLAGFPLAAYLATHLGFGLSLSAALPAIIQAHGQVQIFGWLGLFIMGVSLHFLPRLSGVPLARHRRLLAVPGWLVASAVALRTVAQPALALAPDGRWQPYAMVLSGICLAAGVGIYVALIVVIVSRRRDAETHPTILSLRPWLILALAGWLGSGGLLAGGAVAAGMAEDALVDADLQRLGVDLYIGAVLIPVAFVFARQVLPLYLRVDMMPPQGLPLMAMAYAVTVVAFVTADLMGHAPALAVARLLQAVLILWVFSRLRIHRRRDPRGRIRPERDGAARFGKFAPAIYLSFGFLLLAALGQMVSADCALADIRPLVRAAGIRHAYVAGFGTLLLLGVAPRLIPGFLGVRGPAWPRLVRPAWLLGAVAALGVSTGLGLPTAILPEPARLLFGLSGSLAWIAVALLAANLWATFLRRPR